MWILHWVWCLRKDPSRRGAELFGIRIILCWLFLQKIAKALKMNRPSSFVSYIYFYTFPMQKKALNKGDTSHPQTWISDLFPTFPFKLCIQKDLKATFPLCMFLVWVSSQPNCLPPWLLSLCTLTPKSCVSTLGPLGFRNLWQPTA